MSSTRLLTKGNVAAMKGAILAGCRSYYGYPITPASEIAEAAAALLPKVGGVFLQAESEIASINMVYGAAAAGQRTMTASSSPGVSLMQEGLSYAAGAELPFVLIDITRGGPGLGNIAPEQSDYNQMVKGGGHGCYKVPVLAPQSAQEMCSLTMLAFELAEKYRTPTCVMADGFIGQMMEPVEFPGPVLEPPTRPWCVDGTAQTRDNLITSIYLDPDILEAHVRMLEKKYQAIEAEEIRFEEIQTDDADFVVVGYGIISRIAESAIAIARNQGIRVGLLRPITLWPFPQARIRELAASTKAFLTVELSTGQMVDDVRLAVEGRTPVRFYGRVGGNVPSVEELTQQIVALAEGAS